MLDVLEAPQLRELHVAYLHYTYLWPLRTDELMALVARAVRVVSVEQNYQGQLGMLISMECGLQIPDRILKYDGRPFFYDELLAHILQQAGTPTEDGANQRQPIRGLRAGVNS